MTHDDHASLPAPAAALSPVPIAPSTTLRSALHTLQTFPRAIVLGASGGIDSTAAMLLLAHAGVPTLVVHVHHHLREDADSDARTVRTQAELLGLPAITVHLPPPTDQTTENISARSRRLRYDALTGYAARLNADVLTAHHANDLLETFLMRVDRGAGLPRVFGLRNPMHWNGTAVIRPLLNVWKRDLRALVEQTDFPWIEDSSNASTAYARNELRAKMQPLVEHLQRSTSFSRTLAQLAQEASALDAQDARALDDLLGPAPNAVLRHMHGGAHSQWIGRLAAMRTWSHDLDAFTDALYRWCSDQKIMPRREVLTHITRTLWEGRATTRDLQGLRLDVSARGLVLTLSPAQNAPVKDNIPVEYQMLHADRWTQVGIYRVRLETPTDGLDVWARPWMAGDRFSSPHSGRMVGVRKRLARDGVPVHERDQAVVILARSSRAHSRLAFDCKASNTLSSTSPSSDTGGDASSSMTAVTNPTLPRAPIVGIIHQANQRLEIRAAQGMRLVVVSGSTVPDKGIESS